MERHVSAWMSATVDEGTTLALLVAPRIAGDGASPGTEEFTARAGERTLAVEETTDLYGNRMHVLRDMPAGRIEIRYGARGVRTGEVTDGDAAVSGEEITYLRPSRYCEVDEFGAVAGDIVGESQGHEAAHRIVDWVHEHLSYVPGSSTISDSARSTFIARQGVCRDYAHLTATLLRAAGIPARCTAVYAPGLSPMNFHLVNEAWIDGSWWLLDSTHMAPRESMLPISTGLDAADTAFMATLEGHVELTGILVSAVVDPVLPLELWSEDVRVVH